MSICELCGIFNQPNTHVLCIPEQRETQNIFEELMATVPQNYILNKLYA